MEYVDIMTKMMAGSLGLEEPWYISSVKFDEKELSLHIYVDIRKSAEIACPICGGTTKRYGYEKKERIWRHGDCMFYPTYVHCKRPKIICNNCGVKQINAPFERKNSRFTMLFEGYSMLIMADMPISKTAALLRCDEKALVSIMKYWVNKAIDNRKLNEVTALAIDETSFRKGHKYVTLIIDSSKRCVIDVEDGRDSKVVSLFANKLSQKGGNPLNIVAVTSDMSKSYIPAIKANFPNAEHTIDKFHVKQMFIKALDDVRKAEQKAISDKKQLFQGRKLLMIPETKLSTKQREKIFEMSRLYPLTGRAYRIVTALDDFYQCHTPEEAESAFQGLYSWMRRCRLEPMKTTAETFKRHKDKIINFFRNRLTNAICEGINSMVQAAKRKARGYHTFDGFASIIYLIAGKLELAVPKPF